MITTTVIFIKNKDVDTMIDITNIKPNTRVYNGSETKYGIELNGINYIVKHQKKDWRNVESEVIASRFISKCGLPAHNTLFAKSDGKLVALCEDFTDTHGDLKTLASINSSSIDTDTGKYDYYFKDIVYELNKIRNVDMDDVINKFYKMFFLDGIVGNPDRHKGNWGLCKDSEGIYRMSPIFDNGASLFPRNNNFNITEEWMRERTITFPNSKIMFLTRERSSYRDVWEEADIPTSVKLDILNLDVVGCMDDVAKELELTQELTNYYRTIVYYRHTYIVTGEFEWRGMLCK